MSHEQLIKLKDKFTANAEEFDGLMMEVLGFCEELSEENDKLKAEIERHKLSLLTE